MKLEMFLVLEDLYLDTRSWCYEPVVCILSPSVRVQWLEPAEKEVRRRLGPWVVRWSISTTLVPNEELFNHPILIHSDYLLHVVTLNMFHYTLHYITAALLWYAAGSSRKKNTYFYSSWRVFVQLLSRFRLYCHSHSSWKILRESMRCVRLSFSCSSSWFWFVWLLQQATPPSTVSWRAKASRRGALARWSCGPSHTNMNTM